MTNSVALIYPYFLTDAKAHVLFPPLGIAMLASQIHSSGVGVQQYDCTFRRFDEVVDAVTLQMPAVVGIYTMATMSKSALRLVETLRVRLPAALFVAGGPLPSVYPGRFARHFDVVFQGEADLTFAAFCNAYLARASRACVSAIVNSGTYPGIYLNAGGRVIAHQPTHHSEEVIDALPLPDRAGVDQRPYQDFWMKECGSKVTTIMPTRGCPYACDFCSKPIFGNRFRLRSLPGVMAEIEQIIALGYNRLWIADDSFTLDTNYLNAFCSAMVERGHELTWTCLSRVTGIDEKMAHRMRAAGCVKVYLGLESGSDSTLRLMKKGACVSDAEQAVSRFCQAGVKTAGFFMVGYPNESALDVERTFEFALRLPLDEISFTVPYPLPGSALYNRVTGVHEEDDWEIENEVNLLFSSQFDAAQLQRRIDETMSAFTARRRGQRAEGQLD